MLKVFFIILSLLAVAMLLMCVRVLVKPDGKFSSQHIGESKEMRKRGITCATSTDRRDRRAASKRMNVKEM